VPVGSGVFAVWREVESVLRQTIWLNKCAAAKIGTGKGKHVCGPYLRRRNLSPGFDFLAPWIRRHFASMAQKNDETFLFIVANSE